MMRTHSQDIHGNQAGDPEKAAEVFIKLAGMEQPPVHQYLGSDSYQYVNQKIKNLQRTMQENKTLGVSTDFEND